MALLAVGRRLPVLRDLSLAVAKCDLISTSQNVILTANMSSNASNTPASSSGGDSATTSPASGTATSDVATGSAPVSTPQPGDEEDWTEVVHSSGQLYYWNQRTGETTQLGEPKPQSGRGGGGDRAGDGAGAGAGAGPTRDPRAEAPIDDKTGTYAAMGVLIGAFLGWFSQFV